MKHLLDRKDNIMKNITFTYDGWMDGEQGEACMTVMVDDERAEMLDAAFNAPAKLPKTKVLILKDQTERLCNACECIRGREYASGSIKTVEVRHNPQFKSGGYETTRKITAVSIASARKRAREITEHCVYGSMELLDVRKEV